VGGCLPCVQVSLAVWQRPKPTFANEDSSITGQVVDGTAEHTKEDGTENMVDPKIDNTKIIGATEGPIRTIGRKTVGADNPVYVVGEIGINHNGDLENAFGLIDAAVDAGCDAVKFQKRTPETCTPRDQWDIERDTPWGRMRYIDYRHRVEFGVDDYQAIDDYCKAKEIAWFASPWDMESVDFLEQFDVPAHKVASASLTDDQLLTKLRSTGRTVILSTGMSTPRQIRHAVEVLGSDNVVMLHATSTYPAKNTELNLRMIPTLQREFPNVPIGYSGHETGLQTSVAAVVLGAVMVERHITLDRAMWGSDQAASVEPQGLDRLVRDIRAIENALGDGVKHIYEGEMSAMRKLRRVRSETDDAEAQSLLTVS
jgi:N-acetylneuraminate synthase